MPTMTMRDFRARLARNAEGAGGGAAETGTTETQTQEAGAGTGAAEGAARWWEDPKWADEDRQFLTVKGLTIDDPMEATRKLAQMYRNAETRLGKPADAILEKPKAGQDVAEWLRANAPALGLPDKAEGYEVKRPEGWPEGADWDADLEARARAIAFEEGLPPKALQKMVGLYAEKVRALNEAADATLAADETNMRAALEKDWGDQLDARLARARQAAGVIAQDAGLDAAALEAVAAQISKGAGGSAATIRLFDAIASKMGEDSAAGLRAGATSFTMTPAEARAAMAKLHAPDSDYGKAVAAGDVERIRSFRAEIERLAKIAAR